MPEEHKKNVHKSGSRRENRDTLFCAARETVRAIQFNAGCLSGCLKSKPGEYRGKNSDCRESVFFRSVGTSKTLIYKAFSNLEILQNGLSRQSEKFLLFLSGGPSGHKWGGVFFCRFREECWWGKGSRQALILRLSYNKQINYSERGCIKMERRIKIFIAGDSTAATKVPDRKPETGWGERIPEFFTGQAEFLNFAVNGRSSKSFIDEGILQKIAESIQAGDYLFVEFGHNDEKPNEELYTEPFTTYKTYLTKYIEVARNAGAHPLLLTSIHRRNFDEKGMIKDSHGDFLIAVRELAAELNVPIIDMSEKSKRLFEQAGIEKTKEIFLWVKPGESPNYPDGVEDNTHFSVYGAKEIARLVVEGIQELQLQPLASLIKK